MKKHIPNLITLLNLLSGCIAILFAVKGTLEMAAIFVVLGIFFDFFDGLAARLLNVQSELGVQLDSLADMVTSGVVPGIIMFQLLVMSASGDWGAHSHTNSFMEWEGFNMPAIALIGFVITLAAAYRLAKFNIDENQTTSFIGLPTPACALFVIALPLILYYHTNETVQTLILNKWFLIGCVLVLSYLMNANIPLFALKFKDWSFKSNAIKYTFLLLSLVAIIIMKFMAIPLIVIGYVLFSVVAEKVFATKEI
jgi:CDP-diacylglycerol--serine O-phosphatidyltransferase